MSKAMKFPWSAAASGGGASSVPSATSDVKAELECSHHQHSLPQYPAVVLANSAYPATLRQPRQQISYVYTDAIKSLRFPVLQTLPREICSCCAKVHRIDRAASPPASPTALIDPSKKNSTHAPRTPSSSPKIMFGKVKSGGKAGFDKLYGWVDKLGAPVNKLSNKLGAEAFWPTTLDLESDKAARILRSFCKDGFYEEDVKAAPGGGPSAKQRVIKKIPAEVIKNAKGLAIFTTMRTGLWFSGAGGSGILIGRLPDGSWSPPSGLMLHTAGLGFLVGVDIYDCVMVINTDEAMKAFSKIRATVGGEMSAVAGPVGVGGVLDSEVHKRHAPIFTYLKSRGFYAGVQIDGTILIERTDENERFYGQKLPVEDILGGKVRHPPYELNTLMATLRAAQGDTVADSELPSGQSPSDFEIDDGRLFGVPDKMDPDPYGVLALEKEGFEIREAGTKSRASHESFIFNPSPSSPLFNFNANRNSIDGKSISRRSSWRTSTFSAAAHTDRSTQTMDMATQTDFDTPATSPSGLSSSTRNTKMTDIAERRSEDRHNQLSDEAPQASSEKELPLSSDEKTSPQTENVKVTPQASDEKTLPEPKEVTAISDEKTPQDPKQETVISNENATVTNGIDHEATEMNDKTAHPQTASIALVDTHKDGKDVESDDEEEHVVVHTIQKAATPQFISKARLVSVKKQQPPALPPRNPIREVKRPVIITGDNLHDEDPKDQGTSPMSRNASISSIYKSDIEAPSSGHSMSSVDLGEEMKNERPLRPSVDEIEEPTQLARSPSPVHNPMPGQFT